MRPLLVSIAMAVCCAIGFASSPDSNRSISGAGIIDRVIASGSEPVFRADGYLFRVGTATQLHFSGGLQALTDVDAGIWVSFEGKPNDAGEIVAEKARFKKVKWPKREPNSKTRQATSFPKGSKVDGDNGFEVTTADLPELDKGGWCGWYPVTEDAALQERVRNLGWREVPKYQRDLPPDDPAKIPFQFYAVGGTQMRTAIFCNDGLVLIPMVVIDRLSSDDLLAAVLADGVAGALQLQAANVFHFTKPSREELVWMGVAVGATAVGGGPVVSLVENHEYKRMLEHDRGRVALALLSDAGFDPHKAPEAWRLLAPSRAPKNPLNLKDPERSQYLEGILKVQYDVPASGDANAPTAEKKAQTPASQPATPQP